MIALGSGHPTRIICSALIATLKHIPAHDADELVSLVPTDELLEQEIA